MLLIDAICVNILEIFNDMASASSDGNSSANDHFTTNEGNTVSFSSANNNGGNHGRFSMSGVFNFKGEVLCSSIEGNQVLLQVLVTNLGLVPAGAEGAFAEGTSWLYLLEDNGEGSKAAADRYYTVALTAGLFDIPICDFLPIADFLTIASGCPCGPQWCEVTGQGDQIQVK